MPTAREVTEHLNAAVARHRDAGRELAWGTVDNVTDPAGYTIRSTVKETVIETMIYLRDGLSIDAYYETLFRAIEELDGCTVIPFDSARRRHPRRLGGGAVGGVVATVATAAALLAAPGVSWLPDLTGHHDVATAPGGPAAPGVVAVGRPGRVAAVTPEVAAASLPAVFQAQVTRVQAVVPSRVSPEQVAKWRKSVAAARALRQQTKSSTAPATETAAPTPSKPAPNPLTRVLSTLANLG